MDCSDKTGCRVHRWSVGLAVAVAGAVAAMMAIADAPAACADADADITSPLGFAESSILHFAITESLLHEYFLPAAYQSVVAGQSTVIEDASDALNSSVPIQESLMSHGDFTGLTAFLFNSADLQFGNDVLGQYQTIEAFVAHPSFDSEWKVLVSDYQLGSDGWELTLLDDIAPFLGADAAATASVDLVSSFDPTDLMSF